jgi:hypothetical protein
VHVLFSQVVPEDYSANGAAPTFGQLLHELLQSLTEFSIAGTAITVKKRDHATTATVYTLNDPVNPTARTRST